MCTCTHILYHSILITKLIHIETSLTCAKVTHKKLDKARSLSHTDTQDNRLSSPQGRSLPKCSAVDKLSLKWNSSANRARQSLGKWLCNQPLLTPFLSRSHSHTLSLPVIPTVNQHVRFTVTKEALLCSYMH